MHGTHRVPLKVGSLETRLVVHESHGVEPEPGSRQHPGQCLAPTPGGPSNDGELAGVVRSLPVADWVVPVGSRPPARLTALGELCRAQAVGLLHFGVRWDAGDERVPTQVPDSGTAS